MCIVSLVLCWLILLWLLSVKFILEYLFVCGIYVKNGSARNASNIFWHQFLQITIPHRRTIYRIINTLTHRVITELKKGELKQQMALQRSWINYAGIELREENDFVANYSSQCRSFKLCHKGLKNSLICHLLIFSWVKWDVWEWKNAVSYRRANIKINGNVYSSTAYTFTKCHFAYLNFLDVHILQMQRLCCKTNHTDIFNFTDLRIMFFRI
jgi:hypothetical protein